MATKIGGQPPQFPALTQSMRSLIGDISYSLSGTTGGDIDITYDEWLIPTPLYIGGIGGSLEVMVMPYFNFAYGPAGSFCQNLHGAGDRERYSHQYELRRVFDRDRRR